MMTGERGTMRDVLRTGDVGLEGHVLVGVWILFLGSSVAFA